MIRRWTLAAALCALYACQTDEGTREPLTREQLLDPESCKECHAQHYNEWSGSMHAYASKDPVFRAMNKRGQEEANLGDFCVQCHAPMAVRENAISDFGDLSSVPEHLQGVTCYFCHNAVSVGEPHNNANIQLANDTIMRANLTNPVKPRAHGVASTVFHDGSKMESSLMCGTCHDIVTPNGTHLERTLLQYQGSLLASPDPEVFQSCQDCHMDVSRTKRPAAPGYEGVTLRTTHSHLWPAVDVALTPDFPNQAAMRLAVEKCELQQRSISYVVVTEGDVGVPWTPGMPYRFRVDLETNAGHAMPSGVSHDRRMWLEVIASNAAGEQIWSSGVIADDELEEKPPPDPARPDPAYDDQLCMFRDRFADANGQEAHMFWDAVGEPLSTSKLLPAAKDARAGGHTATCSYTLRRTDGPSGPPARLHLRLRMRPMGLDVLRDLERSGHLDPAVTAAIPTFTVLEQDHTYDMKTRTYVKKDLTDPDCDTFRCMLDPQDCPESAP